MAQLIPITLFFVKYGVLLSALIISCATLLAMWAVLKHETRDIPYPPHFTRTEQHDEFDRLVRIRRAEDSWGCIVLVLPLIGAGIFWTVRDRLLAMPATFQRVVCGSVFILTIAGLLFLLRMKALRSYAVMEISFGLAFSAATLYRMKDQIEVVEATVLGTAIYLLIRGLDNFKKDLDERNKGRKAVPPNVGASAGQS